MFYSRLLVLLLTLTLTSCATARIRPQEWRRHYSCATLHYHRIHGQTLRHPNYFQ